MSPAETLKGLTLGEWLDRSQKNSTSRVPSPAARLREDANRALETLSLPTSRDEEWRFTALGPLLEARFIESAPSAPVLSSTPIGRFLLGEAEGSRLVFVDGVYAPGLSGLKPAEGCAIAPLSEAPAHGFEAYLGRLASLENEVFTALNGASFTEGALVHVSRRAQCPTPIQLLFVSTGRAALAVSPRCLVVIESGAAATVIEEYVCLEEGATLTNAVTEIFLEENASLSHSRVQSESRQGFHVGRVAVSVGTDARYAMQSITLGSRISRFELDILQAGEGIDVCLDGLAVIAGRQVADSHTTLDHARPHGHSEQLHKTIVGDQAHAVFNGRIVVRHGAQRTDSSQSSRNLLLTERARVDAKPELEIFADDVKCAHGATVGQIDDDELFYLQSRGLSETQSRELLVYAFAAEIIAKLPTASLQRQITAVVLKQTQAR